jgi:hypothetical protein
MEHTFIQKENKTNENVINQYHRNVESAIFCIPKRDVAEEGRMKYNSIEGHDQIEIIE